MIIYHPSHLLREPETASDDGIQPVEPPTRFTLTDWWKKRSPRYLAATTSTATTTTTTTTTTTLQPKPKKNNNQKAAATTINHNIVFYLIFFFRTDAEVLWNLPGFGVPKGDEKSTPIIVLCCLLFLPESCKVGPLPVITWVIRPFKGVITPLITIVGAHLLVPWKILLPFGAPFSHVPPWWDQD